MFESPSLFVPLTPALPEENPVEAEPNHVPPVTEGEGRGILSNAFAPAGFWIGNITQNKTKSWRGVL